MRSVNKVLLVGHLTRDPEFRHTEGNKSVCSFRLATNRNWINEDGERKEDTDFHRIVAWGKLGETCQKYLRKGRLVYLEGRLHTHSWIDNEGVQRTAPEIVLDDMKMLDGKRPETQEVEATHSENQQAVTAV
jgi:single-strand DNA-binding protein